MTAPRKAAGVRMLKCSYFSVVSCCAPLSRRRPSFQSIWTCSEGNRHPPSSQARLPHKIGSPSGIPAFGSTTARRRAPQHSSANVGENMDTNTLLIIVVALLLLGGGGFFYRSRA
jgi:LPXTG-motif cell wall-anchored protein